MPETRPTWQLVIEAAHALGASNQEPFKLEQLLEFVQRKDGSRSGGSIAPIVQGMTINAGKGPHSPCGKVLRRVRPGFYELVAGDATQPRRATTSSDLGIQQASVISAEPLAAPPGDSAVQRAAETEILRIASAELGVPLSPRRLILADGVRIELDGASDDLGVLCEVWAHQGSAKVAQGHKVLGDAVKLYLAAASMASTPRLILIVTDAAAVSRFRGKSWYAHALRVLGVGLHVVAIPEELRQRIKHAQDQQFR